MLKTVENKSQPIKNVQIGINTVGMSEVYKLLNLLKCENMYLFNIGTTDKN